MQRIWTIGHSTRKIDDFISLLKANGIKLVADVRMLPGSKRYPQFNQEALAQSLSEAGIVYEHFPELGGRRKTKPDSRNTAWRNESFRGYADHMETDGFSKGIDRLIDLCEGWGRGGLFFFLGGAEKIGPTAIMWAGEGGGGCHPFISLFSHGAWRWCTLWVLKKNKPNPFTLRGWVVNGT